jgi:hypothetical protein
MGVLKSAKVEAGASVQCGAGPLSWSPRGCLLPVGRVLGEGVRRQPKQRACERE